MNVKMILECYPQHKHLKIFPADIQCPQYRHLIRIDAYCIQWGRFYEKVL